MMDEKEAIILRKQLVMSALHDGKAKSFEDAIIKAEMVYNWIITGNRSR